MRSAGAGSWRCRHHRIGPYEPYGTGLFLVRPDGYVGWAGGDATGLARYLARLSRSRRPDGLTA